MLDLAKTTILQSMKFSSIAKVDENRSPPTVKSIEMQHDVNFLALENYEHVRIWCIRMNKTLNTRYDYIHKI